MQLFKFIRLGVYPIVFGCIFVISLPVAAQVLPFDDTWKKQGFFRLWSNKYQLRGTELGIISNGTVSLLYRPVPRSNWDAKTAAWDWSVSQSVVATDLTVKGGDDRNLAIYFVFVDANSAEKLASQPARKLLQNNETKALVYVWGGDYKPETLLTSPYSPESLKMIIRRPVGVGSFMESVDLQADFKRAFKQKAGVLLGIAITADSDDTNGRIDAVIQNITIK